MTRKTAAIINPRSAGGKTARLWPQIAAKLGDVSFHFTKQSGHAIALSRELLAQGFECIIAVGGDGTVNEVINGFLCDDVPVNPEACLAVLPIGSGSDFQRTLGIKNIKEALEVIRSGISRPIDAGKATFLGHNGVRQSRYFANLVSFGMGGAVAARSRNFLSALGGKIAFLYATLEVFLRYRAKQVRVSLDGAGGRSHSIMNIAIGNGRFHGGGMHVCPKAVLDDGLLEVTVIDHLHLWELLSSLPLLYSENIYAHPKVHHLRVRRLAAEATEPVLLEIDGEPLGRLPLEVSILPGRLRVLAPMQ